MESNSTCPDSTCQYRNRATGYCGYTGPCVMVGRTVKIYDTSMKNETPKKTPDDLLDALETVAAMQIDELCGCFDLRPDMVRNGYEGLYAVITTHTADQIFETVKIYLNEKMSKKILDEKNRVKKLADEFGIHKLYAYVTELRGEP